MKKAAILISIVFLTFNLSGCAVVLSAAAGGAGVALWLSGKLEDQVKAPYEHTVEAAKQALDSLEMKVTKQTITDQTTQLISRYKDGSRVWIDISPVTQSTSKIEVRVSIKGDKSASSEILEEIRKHL